MRYSIIVFAAVALLMSGCLGDRDTIDPQKQLQMDIETIDKYLANNLIGALKDPSGIRVHINILGEGGFPPSLNQQVMLTYAASFLDGGTFDSGSTTFNIRELVGGMQLGLILLPPGSVATIYVPSPLGYGAEQFAAIPPNSILKFEVEVGEVVLSTAEKQRKISDIGVIDKYLTDNNITAIPDTTGVRYVITNPGSETIPTWYSKVRFQSTGKVLASGAQFYEGISEPKGAFDSRVVDYLHGIKVALHKIGVGGKITAYVPSGLGFGTQDNSGSNVPANSNLVYEIELLEIVP
jgi:FKBP-type peptidyl-prolyl cis-trans isomerase